MLTHLPHRISIMTENRTAFQGGTYTTSWTTASTTWANCQVNTKSFYNVQESHQLQKKQQLNTWTVIMRADNSISNKNRIIFHDETIDGSTDRILTIETVSNPTARRRMLELKCREEVI